MNYDTKRIRLLPVAAVFFAALPNAALAAIADVTEEELVGLAQYIVQGTVTAVETESTGTGFGVKTVVSIYVDDSLKGRLNKGSFIYLDLPVGRSGSLVRTASELPDFSQGEEIIIFLKYFGRRGYAISGGIRGKHVIGRDPLVGKPSVIQDKDRDYIVGVSTVSHSALRKVAQKVAKEKGETLKSGPGANAISLGEYKRFIRRVVKDQQKQGR